MSERIDLPPGSGSCPTGKIQYPSRKRARASRRNHHDRTLSVYACPKCGWFHLGHLPTRVRNGEVDKAAWAAGKRQR